MAQLANLSSQIFLQKTGADRKSWSIFKVCQFGLPETRDHQGISAFGISQGRLKRVLEVCRIKWKWCLTNNKETGWKVINSLCGQAWKKNMITLYILSWICDLSKVSHDYDVNTICDQWFIRSLNHITNCNYNALIMPYNGWTCHAEWVDFSSTINNHFCCWKSIKLKWCLPNIGTNWKVDGYIPTVSFHWDVVRLWPKGLHHRFQKL